MPYSDNSGILLPPTDTGNTGGGTHNLSSAPQQPTTTTTNTGVDYTDPNAIKVTISDKKSPLVILYGPPSCGKTMTLIRLARYLRGQNYTLEPRRDFRPNDDNTYKTLCDNFDQMVSSDDAAMSTSHVDFMLVRVLRNGTAVCQFLEGPGELYFDPKDPNMSYPAYMNAITQSNNRRIWLIMLEPYDPNSIMDSQANSNYVSRISKLVSTEIGHSDKVIFVFNKVDKTNFVRNQTNINYGGLKKEVADIYPDVFAPFRNNNPITRWFRPYTCDFIAFQTGRYNTTTGGSQTFTESNNIFPCRLWAKILTNIKGGLLCE